MLGVIGVFVPVLALLAALRLARPGSVWARRWYRPGASRLVAALRRAVSARAPDTPGHLVVDLFAACPPAATSPTVAVGPPPPITPR